jgi:hypothetical protein
VAFPVRFSAPRFSCTRSASPRFATKFASPCLYRSPVCCDSPLNPYRPESISHRPRTTPSEQLPADYSFLQQPWPAVRQLIASTFSNPPTSARLCRVIATNAGLPLFSATFCALPCVSVDSSFSFLPSQCRSRFRLLTRLPDLRGMHPSRQRYPMLSVGLLSSSGQPRSRP